MIRQEQEGARAARILAFVTLFALGMIVLRITLADGTPLEQLVNAGNDDIMRMLSVRAWLNGQSWFDMTQYGVLPPEGLSMHWSRLVDLGIAALIGPLTPLLGSEAAESAALVIWPSLLQAGLILLTARMGTRLFGPLAATIAVLCILFWPVTDLNYFRVAALDHHNVQILLATIVTLGVLDPERPVRAGVLTGLAAALSLAVGLETLPIIGLAGVVLFGRALSGDRCDGVVLVVFAAAMFLGALSLHVVQTPPDLWRVASCDRLSPPFLALAGTGLAVAAPTAWLARHIASPRRRVAAGLGLAACGAAALLPAILPCLEGPYGALSPEIQEIIAERIREAYPAHRFLLEGESVFYSHVAPAVATFFLAGLVLVARMRAGHADAAEVRRAGTLLLFAAAALALTFVQIRQMVLAAPVTPILMGYALAALVDARSRHRGSASHAIALIAGSAATLFLPPLSMMVSRELSAARAEASTPDAHTASGACRTADALRSLNAVPAGRILAPSNYGAPLLLLTSHSVFAAPYHRSGEAIANGILPFERDKNYLLQTLADTDADYLLLCRGSRYGGGTGFAHALANGEEIPALQPVAGVDPALMLLKVMRE